MIGNVAGMDRRTAFVVVVYGSRAAHVAGRRHS
jgi:hypothetical protein